MKTRAIALSTFAGLLRNKLIVFFCAGFVCIVLLMLAPLTMMKTLAKSSPDVMESSTYPLIGAIMGLVSGFGALLAAWSAADAVWSEMKSGTILAVLARPVRRWEFLLGKYLGVQMLLAVYILLMFGLSYVLAWIGGGRIQPQPWVLLVYPMVRYAAYSAIAMLLAAAMHPVVAFGIVMILSVLSSALAPGSRLASIPEWLRSAIYTVLPSTGLLSESRFLSITESKLKQMPWTDHAVALAYGLDYALVFFLLAAWAFRRRGLTRD